jgi:hypothetical protein
LFEEDSEEGCRRIAASTDWIIGFWAAVICRRVSWEGIRGSLGSDGSRIGPPALAAVGADSGSKIWERMVESLEVKFRFVRLDLISIAAAAVAAMIDGFVFGPRVDWRQDTRRGFENNKTI